MSRLQSHAIYAALALAGVRSALAGWRAGRPTAIEAIPTTAVPA